MINDADMSKEFEDAGSIYPKVEVELIERKMGTVVVDVHQVPNTTTLVGTAILPVRDGEHPIKFTLCTEIMACVDPRNFNRELGEKYLKEKVLASAKNELWKLEGYALACKMSEGE
jgi:hypothetical protein